MPEPLPNLGLPVVGDQPTDLMLEEERKRNSDLLRSRVVAAINKNTPLGQGSEAARKVYRATRSRNLATDFPEEARQAAVSMFNLSAAAASQDSPDEAARLLKLSEDTGAPVEALRDPKLRKEYESMSRFVGMKPHELAGVPLGEWMQRDPMNMSLSYDDKSLTDMQQAVKDLPPSLKDEGAQRAYIEARVKKAQNDRNISELANASGLFYNTITGAFQSALERGNKAVFGALNWIEQNVPGFGSPQGVEPMKFKPIADEMGSLATNYATKHAMPRMLQNKQTGAWFKNPDYDHWYSEFANRDIGNQLENFPGEFAKLWLETQMMASLTGLPAPEAQKALGIVLGAESGAAAIERAAQRRQELGQPANPTLDLFEGLIDGGTTAMLFGNRFGRFGLPEATPAKTLLGEFGMRTGRAAALGTASAVTTNLASRLHGDTPDVWEGALASAISFLPWEHMSTFERLKESSRESLLLKRSKTKFLEATREMVKGTDVETAVINPNELQRLFQEKAPGEKADRFLQNLGVGADQIRVARAANGTVDVPMERYLAEVSQHKLAGEIGDITRLAADPSLTMGSLKGRVLQIAETARLYQRMEQLPTSDPIRDQIRDSIAADLIGSTKALTEKQSKEFGEFYARMIMVLAERAEKTPQEILDKNRLTIVRKFNEAFSKEAPNGGTGRPVVAEAAAGVPRAEAGRTTSGVSGSTDGVQAGGGAGNEGRVGEGPRPPAWLWHGTLGSHGNLRAEGINDASAKGMGPGLHSTAGPHVADEHTAGDGTGLWRVGIRSNYTPFDASTESSYTPEQAAQFGVKTSVPVSGMDLWAALSATIGSDKAVALLQEKGFHGLYYNYGGEDAWSVWKDEHIAGSVPTDMQQAQADYARQGSRRDEVTGMLKAGQPTKLWQPIKGWSTPREQLRSARRLGAEDMTFTEFKDALGWSAKHKSAFEFMGETGDKALRSLFKMSQVKELAGAPPTVRTEADRTRLLEKLVEMAKVGEAGRFWYDDSAKAFLELAGGNEVEAFKLATLTALYSPQTSVADNGRRAILAYYDAMHNMEISAGGVHPKVKELAAKLMKATTMQEVADVMSGQKTSAFQQNLIDLFAPDHADKDVATIDLHMMRAAGFDKEAPTPTQYKWVEDLTREVAAELGWKPKEAQAAVWVAQKMRTDNKGKGSDAKQSGFHYGDAAQKISGNLNVESMPGSDALQRVFPNIGKATRGQLEQYHQEKLAVVRAALRDAGVMVAGEKTGHGYWNGASNPVTSFVIPLPHVGGEGEHTLAPSAVAEITRAARIVADVVGDQDSIGWNKPFSTTTVGEANGMHYHLARELTHMEMVKLGETFHAAGLDAFIDAADPANLKVINYNWEGVTKGESGAKASKLAKAYHDLVDGLILSALPADTEPERDNFHATSGLVTGSQQDASQTETTAGLPTSEASPLQPGLIARGRAQVEALNERYRTEFGWGAEAGSGAGGSRPVFAGRGAPEGSSSFHGVHFSAAQHLTELRGDFYGTGSAGRERSRLAGVAESDDPTLQQLGRRSYFYISEDGGLPRKERVVTGNNAFEVQLNGVFDPAADPKQASEMMARAREWADTQTGAGADYNNAFEREVLLAGFNGYAVDAPGGGRMVVLLDPGSVPVRPFDARTDLEGPTAGITRLAQPAYHGSPYKFDKFTLSHIGSGEGNQSYGWGLYFAGDQSVAKWYHENLASTTRAHNTLDGKRITPKMLEELKKSEGPAVQNLLGRTLTGNMLRNRDFRPIIDSAIEDAEHNLAFNKQRLEEVQKPDVVASTYKPDHYERMIMHYATTANELRNFRDRLDFVDAKKGGQLYKVELPDDSSLLHQDRDFQKQSPEIKAALRELIMSDSFPENAVADMDATSKEDLARKLLRPAYSGRNIYWTLSEIYGSAKATSEALASVGIKGMSYLDGNSRGLGRGPGGYGQPSEAKHNYVIFDDSAINILQTYYAGGDPKAGRGFLEFGKRTDGTPREFSVELLKHENKSTIFHEIGHFYLEVLSDLADAPDASPAVKAQWEAIKKHFGIESYDQLTPAMHEKFADGLLLYLKEGKALTADMRTTLRDTAKWFTKLGDTLISAKVEMNDELRGIFDRLIASDKEIEAAKMELPGRIFSTAEQAGMTDREFAAYQETARKQIDEGREKLVAKLVRQMERVQNAEYKKELTAVREEVAAQVDARPEYQALSALAKGTLADGETPVKLNREALVEAYGKEILNELGKLGARRVYGDGPDTLAPDDAAVRLNLFDGNGDLLVQALRGLKPRSELIAETSRGLMEERFPTLLQDKEALRTEAIRQIVESGEADLLAMEVAALRRKAREAKAGVAAARGDALDEAKVAAAARGALHEEQQRISADKAKEDRAAQREALDLPDNNSLRLAASAFIANQRVFELRPDRLLAAMRSASSEAYRASLRNDYEAAADAKERELLNHHLYLEAVRAKAEGEAFRTWVKRNDSGTVRGNLGEAGGEYLAQFDAIRDMLSIERAPNKALIKEQSLADWVRTQEDEAKDPVIADWMKQLQAPINYRSLTTAQLRDVYAALKNIKHLAYLELGTMIEGKRVAYETMISDLVSAIETNSTKFVPLRERTAISRDTVLEKTAAKLQGLDSLMVKMEVIMNWIDGNDVNGPAHRYIFDRLVKAQADDNQLSLEIHEPILRAMETMPKEMRDRLRTEAVDIGMTDAYGNPAPKTRGEILTMLLYSGQEARRAKLLEGYASRGLTEEKLQAAIERLSPQEVEFAKTIWQAFDKLAPKIVDLEERLTGVRPVWEGGRKVRIHGQDIEGGYFPLVADPVLSPELGKRTEGGTVQMVLSSNGYSRASTSKGHTKELTGAVYPLLLDYQTTLTSAMRNQIKDLTHREAVLSINKVLSNDKFTTAIKERIGEAYETQLMPWLVNIANDGNAGSSMGMGPINRLIEASKANTTAAVLGFKFSTVVVQFADLTRVVAPGDYRVSPLHLSNAYTKLSPLNPNRAEVIAMIKELSPEMAHREEHLDRDMRARLQTLRGDDALTAKWNRAAFHALGMMDSLISWPTWLGAYNQSLAKGADSATAVKEADRTVRTLLMTSAPKDLVPIQANKNPLYKVLTMFMGDATANYNMLRNAGHNIDGLKGIPAFTGTLLFVMMGAIFGDWLKGQGPDKNESAGAWAARKAALAPLGVAPILRDVQQPIDNILAGKPALANYKFTSAMQPIQKLIDFIKHEDANLKGREDWIDTTIRGFEAGGYLTGLGGTQQAADSARYFKRYMEGTEKPDNPVQFAYDLVRGKKKEPNR